MSVWSILTTDTPDRAADRRRPELDRDVVTLVAALAILALFAVALLLAG